jgi:hypothetical protein
VVEDVVCVGEEAEGDVEVEEAEREFWVAAEEEFWQ